MFYLCRKSRLLCLVFLWQAGMWSMFWGGISGLELRFNGTSWTHETVSLPLPAPSTFLLWGVLKVEESELVSASILHTTAMTGRTHTALTTWCVYLHTHTHSNTPALYTPGCLIPVYQSYPGKISHVHDHVKSRYVVVWHFTFHLLSEFCHV